MRTRTASRNARGLTLIEIVVTLLITALIIGAIAGIVLDVRNRRDEVERQMSAEQIGPTILRLITTDLQATFVYRLQSLNEEPEDPFTGNDNGNGNGNGNGDGGGAPAPGAPPPDLPPIDFFVGERHGGEGMDADDSLHFVTSRDSLLRIGTKQSDVTEVGYFLRPSKDDKLEGLYTLYRREDFHIDKEPTSGGHVMKVHDRVIALQFRYYTVPENESEAMDILEGGGDPEPDWDNTEDEGLPFAVEVTVWIDTRVDFRRERENQDVRRYRTLVLLPRYPTAEELEQIAEEDAGDNNANNNNGDGNNGNGNNGNGNGNGNGNDGNGNGNNGNNDG